MDEQVNRSAAGMLFISLPQLFYDVVPLGSILGPFFYVLVALAALTSTISLLEVVVSSLHRREEYVPAQGDPRKRWRNLHLHGAVDSFIRVGPRPFGIRDLRGQGGRVRHTRSLRRELGAPTGWAPDHARSGLVHDAREATERELVDETTPGWFNYGAWRFFMRFVAPTAVAAILVAVIFYGVDFS